MKLFVVVIFILLNVVVFSQQARLGIPIGHTGVIQSIVFTPDSKMLVSGADDNRIKFWDVKSGRVVKTYYQHSSSVKSLEFNTDGNYLLSTSYDSTAIVWDMNTDEPVKVVRELPIYELGAKFDASGNSLAYIYKEKLLVLYHLRRKSETTYFGHNSAISAFSFNSVQTYVASGDKIGKILIHDFNSGENLGVLKGHVGEINDLQFSPDNTKLISTSFDKTCIVWDLQTGKILHQFKKFKNEVYTAQFSADGKQVLITENNTVNQIYNIETGKRLQKLKGQAVLGSKSCYSPKGKYLFLAGNFEHRAEIRSASDYKLLYQLKTPDLIMTAANFSVDDKLLAICFHGTEEIMLFDPESGKLLKILKGSVEANMSAKFNEAEDHLLVSSKNGSSIVWNLKYGMPSKFMNVHDDMVFESYYSPDEKRMMSSSEDNSSLLFDLKTDKVLTHFDIYGDWNNSSRFSFDGKYIFSGTEDNVLECRDAESYELKYQIKKDKYTKFELCSKENKAVVFSTIQNTEIIDLPTGTVLFELPDKDIHPLQAKISPDGKLVAVLYSKNYDESQIKIWDVEKEKVLDSIDFIDRIWWIQMSPDGDQIVFPSEDPTIGKVYDIKTGKMVVSLEGHRNGFLGAEFSPDGTRICTVSGDNKVNLFNLQTGEKVNSLDKHKNGITYVSFSSSGGYIVTASWDGSVILWDGISGDFLLQYYFFENDPENYMVIDDKGYYLSSKKAAEEIYYTIGRSIYPLEQFDLKFNRPDLILSKTKMVDPSLIEAYHTAYKKRLTKMGFTEEMLKDDIHIPTIKIEDFEELPTIIDEGYIDLNLDLQDTKYKLDRINIWVNDVAIYGLDGISLRELDVQELSKTITVNLGKGKNKIQLSVLNQVGGESLKETFDVTCNFGKAKSNLYLITIGESEFEQSQYNLNYAAKDAKDVAELLKNSDAYQDVFTKVLVNEEVTKENVQELKEFLRQADINDQVMIFIAGHGVLDQDFNYYIASHDMDFNNPVERGIPYAELEYLLDGIPSLKKILMIDACHSGELDKEAIQLAENSSTETRDVQFRAVGKNLEAKLGVGNTVELSKSLFTDLRKGTGATVISSAGGMEFAMESADWKNGLFTYCLLKGIRTMAADLDGNGEVWLSEIQTYVSTQVTALSGGMQQPTSRIENQTIDFRIW